MVSSAQLPSIQETGSMLSSGFAIHTVFCGCENQAGCWFRNISWAHLIHIKTSLIAAIILHLTKMCSPQAVSCHVNSHLVSILQFWVLHGLLWNPLHVICISIYIWRTCWQQWKWKGNAVTSVLIMFHGVWFQSSSFTVYLSIHVDTGNSECIIGLFSSKLLWNDSGAVQTGQSSLR